MILITGATGFLGAELTHKLTNQGLRVCALKREHSVIPELLKGNSLIEWRIADINDFSALEDAFEGITQVYHCAAFISFDPKDKAKLLRINIEGTSNIVHLCLAGNQRLVHVSSVAALGDAKKGMQITENDHWEYSPNVHSYAISKYEGEMEVWRGIAEGLDAVIVNPSVIIGPGAGYSGSGAIFKLVKEGLAFYTKGATGIVDVQDVVKSMIALMNSSEHGQRFTISAENLHYKTFFAEIAKGFGVKAPAKEAKAWMLGIAWRGAKLASFFTGKPAALTSDAAKSSMNESLYSNDKITKTIGIQFKPLSQSIQEICTALINSRP
ncbi:nucleoside-diphosphate-sugar epimerase [Pedobacter duraquae]|uniref:Nucleoside-diphosphate-sugar epimerase n=2 Tax=Pedobacter duraquae TaxID=425511 RepID=A0A4R6IHN0_9SPHI|nr:nucleoside-diphosphate-sugar epimerase [Pedobacter duraquae]